MKHLNLLLITVDQMRGDCIGALGHPDVDAPNLDLPRGCRCDVLAELRDVMPTLLQAAGLPIPDCVDG